MDELRLSCSCLGPDIVVVTESWLNNTHEDSLFQLPNFQFLRCDRSNRSGGGIAVWIKSCFPIKRHMFSCRYCELISTCFKIKGRNYVLIALYIPPHLSVTERNEISDALIDHLDVITNDVPNVNIIVAGDFNNFDTVPLQSAHALIDKVTMPTRGDAILDRILVSQSLDCNYPPAHVGPPLSVRRRGSHCQVLLRSEAKDDKCIGEQQHVLYDTSDCYIYNFLLKLNECSFSDVYCEPDIDKKTEIFYNYFFECLSAFPSRLVKMTARDKPWMTPYLKELINKRWNAYRVRNFSLYNHYKIKCKNEIVKCKENWIQRCKQSSRHIWHVFNNVKGKETNNPISGITQNFVDNQAAAEAINDIFVDHLTVSDPIRFSDSDDAWCPLSDPSDVFHFLEHLCVNKSTGSDGIPNKFYKLASPYISEPLCNIINTSIIERKVPSIFKYCIISPVPKSSPVSVDQLRPITLLSTPAKLLEYHVLRHMRSTFYSDIPKFQFAYKPFSNTTSCLITMHNAVTEMLDKTDIGGCIMLNYDFSKAFDTICHATLVEKLRNCNYPSGFIYWLCSYLTNRYQSVKVLDALSSPRPVTSGAPQGSLLGPYLFVLYCNDIKPVSDDTVLTMYADDICEICPIYKDDVEESLGVVTEEFYNLKKWSVSNSLKLNESKTKGICFLKRNFFIVFPFPFVVVDELKILGVVWSKDLTWSSHFQNVVSICNRRIYVLKVVKKLLSHDDLWVAFRATIQSLLLYSTQLFGIYSYDNRKYIEHIFKRARKVICNCDCNCKNDVSCFYRIRVQTFSSLFLKSQNMSHPLFPIVPHLHDGRVKVPYCRTCGRQNCFTVLSSLVYNGLTDLTCIPT